jgi:hypothetical protein
LQASMETNAIPINTAVHAALGKHSYNRNRPPGFASICVQLEGRPLKGMHQSHILTHYSITVSIVCHRVGGKITHHAIAGAMIALGNRMLHLMTRQCMKPMNINMNEPRHKRYDFPHSAWDRILVHSQRGSFHPGGCSQRCALAPRLPLGRSRDARPRKPS